MNQSPKDWPFWLAGLLLGGLTGYVQTRIGDLLLSALMVAAFSMFLGMMRPQRPWRWALLVAVCLPAAQLLAFLTREHPTRAAVYTSFAALAPALVCAYGGSLLRRVLGELFPRGAGSQR